MDERAAPRGRVLAVLSRAADLADPLPAAPRGTELSVTVPLDELEAGGRIHADRQVLARFAARRNTAPASSRRTPAGRRVGAAARRCCPVRHRLSTPTPAVTSPAPKRGRVTIAPANPATFRHQLTGLLTSVIDQGA